MRIPIVIVLAGAALSGCVNVTPPTPPPRTPTLLQMPGTDERQAASLLGAYLVARGYTVRLEGDAAVEAEGTDGSAFTLEILLDPARLDRLVLSRSYPVKEGVDPGLVPAFASELNGALNVGVFSAYPPGILFQASLPFLVEKKRHDRGGASCEITFDNGFCEHSGIFESALVTLR